jgi:hypothetical protein
VQEAPSIINGPPSATATVNASYNFTYATSGYPSPAFSVTAGSLPPGLTLFSLEGVISGLPTATGTYTGTITASNGTGAAATQNFTITVLSTYNFWASQYFTAPQMTEPTISGPTATLENDGVPNLLKYLFDINPAEVMSATDLAAMPTAGLVTSAGTSYLTLTYHQYALETGITVNVQTSPDLQNWTTLTQSQTPTTTTYSLQQTGTDSNTGDPIMQAQVVASGTNEFIRLNITQP